MSRKCSVMSCKSFDGECTFFSIPKTSLSSWTEIIKKINGCETKIKFVSEKHFLPQDIVKTYAGIQDLDFPQKVKPSLVKGAIPQLFNEVEHGICKSEFLTKQTAEGLRVTIKSTLDLSKYLLDIGFHYVLTYKMNRDKLEQFFGIVRQATGPNDHPATPTFIQVYKILSAYSILKPPKSGNCTILETTTPKISLNDIKEVFNADKSLRFTKLQKLSSRIDEIVNSDMWEADDIFDHDYCKSSVNKSV